jgi:hypothetical protein
MASELSSRTPSTSTEATAGVVPSQPEAATKSSPAPTLSVHELLGQVKSSIATATNLDDVGDEIKRRIQNDLSHIQPSLSLIRSPSAALTDHFAKVLPIGWADNNPDAVLRYSVASYLNSDKCCTGLYAKAVQQYAKGTDAYDRLLGDLIPSEISAEGRALAERRAYFQGKNATAAEDWQSYWQGRQRRREQAFSLSTGLVSLDASLGGLRGITFLGGQTGVGKTTLALTMAMAALRLCSDVGVLFYSLDMPKTTVYDRLLCSESGLSYKAILAKEIPAETQEHLRAASDRLRQTVLDRLRVIERTAFEEQTDSVATILYRHRNELVEATGVRSVLFVIDYFQLLNVSTELSSGVDADYERIDDIQEVQRATCTSYNPQGDPFLIISELRKPDGNRSTLTISDLLGSARLGYAADSALLMEPAGDPTNPDAVPVTLRIAKGRDGMQRQDLALSFEHTRSRFTERQDDGGKSAKNRVQQQKRASTLAPSIDPLAGSEAS